MLIWLLILEQTSLQKKIVALSTEHFFFDCWWNKQKWRKTNNSMIFQISWPPFSLPRSNNFKIQNWKEIRECWDSQMHISSFIFRSYCLIRDKTYCKGKTHIMWSLSLEIGLKKQKNGRIWRNNLHKKPVSRRVLWQQVLTRIIYEENLPKLKKFNRFE